MPSVHHLTLRYYSYKNADIWDYKVVDRIASKGICKVPDCRCGQDPDKMISQKCNNTACIHCWTNGHIAETTMEFAHREFDPWIAMMERFRLNYWKLALR